VSALIFLRARFNPTQAIGAVTAYINELFTFRKSKFTLRGILNSARGLGPHSNAERLTKKYVEAAMFEADRQKPNGYFLPCIVQCPSCRRRDTMERRNFELVCKTGDCSFQQAIPQDPPWHEFKLLPDFKWTETLRTPGSPDWFYRVAGTE
jgi:hypothetical protein